MFYLKKETSSYIRDFSYKQPFFAGQIKKDAGELQGQEEVRLQQNPGVSAGTGHVRKEQWKNWGSDSGAIFFLSCFFISLSFLHWKSNMIFLEKSR